MKGSTFLIQKAPRRPDTPYIGSHRSVLPLSNTSCHWFSYRHGHTSPQSPTNRKSNMSPQSERYGSAQLISTRTFYTTRAPPGHSESHRSSRSRSRPQTKNDRGSLQPVEEDRCAKWVRSLYGRSTGSGESPYPADNPPEPDPSAGTRTGQHDNSRDCTPCSLTQSTPISPYTIVRRKVPTEKSHRHGSERKDTDGEPTKKTHESVVDRAPSGRFRCTEISGGRDISPAGLPKRIPVPKKYRANRHWQDFEEITKNQSQRHVEVFEEE
jgi:hypothetical protein